MPCKKKTNENRWNEEKLLVEMYTLKYIVTTEGMLRRESDRHVLNETINISINCNLVTVDMFKRLY